MNTPLNPRADTNAAPKKNLGSPTPEVSEEEAQRILMEGGERARGVTRSLQPPPEPEPRDDSANDLRSRLWEVSQKPKLTGTERQSETAAAVIEWLHERGAFYFYAECRNFSGVMYFDAHRK